MSTLILLIGVASAVLTLESHQVLKKRVDFDGKMNESAVHAAFMRYFEMFAC